MRRPYLLALLVLASTAVACAPSSEPSSGGGAGANGAGGGGTGASTSTGVGGSGGSGPTALDALLAELRADPQAAMAHHANAEGWPVPVVDDGQSGGHLFVSLDPALTLLAGDHDAWAGTPMAPDQGFSWIVLTVPAGDGYKLTDGTAFVADPWARAYGYDEFGEMSYVEPPAPRLERLFGLGDAALAPRTVRIRVPVEPITHALYVHDGQNLFDPSAAFGGWHLGDAPAPGVLLVGVDNTPARMDEYTHVTDVISGQTTGGQGDAYADFLADVVRPAVEARYGAAAKNGVMGSSLGGLVSFHVADRQPGAWDFAASLSGTMGWGSIGAGVHEETMIERYAAHGHRDVVLYVDSGGGGACGDADGDGVDDDDASASDNYCENAQLRDVLTAAGWAEGSDLTYVFAPGAQHDEAAWAARVPAVLELFSSL